MDRKTFIKVALGGAVVVSIPATYYYYRNAGAHSGLENPTALAGIWDATMLTKIGKQYRAQTPSENEANTLTTLVSKDVTVNEVLDVSLLEQKTRDDFEKGHTVLVDGWLLSLTEARQCALFSIHNPS